MRVFSLQQVDSARGPVFRASVFLSSLLAAASVLAANPAPASAQWPAELVGHAVDAVSGEPVEGAVVEVQGTGRTSLTDAAGSFRFRGLEPGRASVEVRRLGYRPHRRAVELENGRSRRIRVALQPAPVSLEGVTARAPGPARSDSRQGVRLDREAVERSGAVTAGELLRGLPGVVVRKRGAGGTETVSLRGSAPDAVLVLLDGVPLNDPVTGEADLSTVPAGSVEEIAVLPGARAARFGGRARAGVVTIETRAPAPGVAGRASAGSLGRLGGAVEAGGAVAHDLRWGAGLEAEAVDGGFRFQHPPSVGGGTGRRRNADVTRGSGWGSVEGRALGGEVAARLGVETLERGLPGRSFAPSDSARQEMDRLRAAARWMRGAGNGRLELSGYWSVQRTRFRDPDPPLGLPYDQRTRTAFSGVRAHGSREMAAGGGETILGAGLELRHAGVEAEGLSTDAPEGWLDGGGFLRGSLRWPDLFGTPELDAALRLDRAGVSGRWHVSHELALGARLGAVSLHAAHRSAFSPPTLGDQFFREGVGVEPNPELRGERVPSEWEAGAELTTGGSRLLLSAGATAFAADVRDMIVWAPDFRFVWSPENLDVERRGVDGWTQLGVVLGPGHRLVLGGHYSLARVTYADPARGGFQLRYRPRHTGSVRLTWSPPGGSLGLEARHTGARLPTPSPANELPPFWTLDLRMERTWTRGPWAVRTRLSVDRLLDRTDALIFAYPDPGRTLELGVHLERRRP